MKKIHPGVWLLLAAIFGFGAFITFNQIGSYGADKNHTNGLFTVLGVVLTLIALLCGWEAKTKGETPRDR